MMWPGSLWRRGGPMTSRKNSVPAEVSVVPPPAAHRADILLLGLNTIEAETLPSRLFGALSPGCVRIDLDMLLPDLLRDAMAILSPIVGPGFDVIEVAQRLRAANFRGRYIAYATEVAHEAMIRAEVQAAAPDLAFDIVTMGHGPRLAAD